MAEGFLTVAVEKMAQAIRTISLERGHDIDGYTLCCFGGAGGQHACRMAEALGLSRVLIHPYAGVLSAYGIGVADERIVRREAVDAPLPDAIATLPDRLDALAQQARRTLGADAEALQVHRRVSLRYRGTDTALSVAADTADAMRDAFAAAYRQRFGFAGPDRPLVVEAIEVEVVRPATVPANEPLAQPRHGPPTPEATVSLYSHGAWHAAPLFERAALQPDDRLSGPAIIAETTGTTVLEPGWQATVNAHGHLLLTPAADTSPSSTASATETSEADAPEADAPDPIRLALFNHRFRAIAERMGTTLQQTATSVNIKERLDFSCAIFDGTGQLVANAPHIPVHLGSMSASVQHVIDAVGDRLAPGAAYALNNPYRGGTHLPDVTVISPVFLSDEAGRPTFFVASRGHHADIGGITPGSMPPTSQHIDEEGVLIDCLPLVDQGAFLEEDWRAVLSSGPHPARNPDQNTADVQAQLAANAHGVQGLTAMVATYGRTTVTAYMQHLQDHAAASVRQAIAALHDGSFTTRLDTGETIRVAVTVDREARSAQLDFTGTAAQVATNFNAPAAITQAAVLYVFRTLVDEDLPLNAGCLAPLEIVVPEGSLLNPRHPAAVVAGNVETSQLVTDALFGALGVLAGSQGTMNNVTFGNERHQYYETICGGAGAGADHPGADAVQVHMTNSRLTDAEVLEARYPVRVLHFGIRAGSGGRGQQPGGAGAVRHLQFLEPMTAAILSSRRVEAPFGLDGGGPGQCGRNTLHRADGSTETLDGTAVVDVQPGDTLIIETPGGGGYGAA
jgi:5-oxoprolinase (ATP-hydrolysing)